jgi:hypothetical protein
MQALGRALRTRMNLREEGGNGAVTSPSTATYFSINVLCRLQQEQVLPMPRHQRQADGHAVGVAYW